MAPATDGADKALNEQLEYMPLITFMLKHGGMPWEEVLASPVLRLNAIHEGLLKHVGEEMAAGMMNGLGGLMGGLTGAAVRQPAPVTQHDTAGMPADAMSNRDAYFKWVNSHT